MKADGRRPVSSSGEKQRVENPYPDNPPAESPLSENQGQYNNNNTIQKNQLLSDKSSIIPLREFHKFSTVEMLKRRMRDITQKKLSITRKS